MNDFWASENFDMENTAYNARALEPYLCWVAPNLRRDRVLTRMMVIIEAVQANFIVIMHSPQGNEA